MTTDVWAWVIPALIALVPAAPRWWSGRTLVARLDDPALPERVLASARLGGFVAVLAASLIVFNSPHQAIWALPLMVVARMVAWYPARRAILEESWSLATYLWFYLRLIGGWYGFWILLAFLPTLANRDGVAGWAIAAALAVVLLAWNRRFADVVRYVMSSKPVASPALLRRFEALAETAKLPQPWFDQVDLRGGVLANAVALASLRRSAVVFTETLIDRLEPDESVAICAHELAHLEYYDRPRLTRLARLWFALIVAGAVLTPLLRQWQPAAVDPARMIWPFVLLVVLVVIARNRQQNETASDLRAVALTGDGEALVRGLTRLHAIARVPRRWNAEAERQATHPSLARRIQAIRRAAGTAPATIEAPQRFASPGESPSGVTFEADRLVWNGAKGDEPIAYETLQEARVEIRRGAPRLIAVDTRGRRRELALRAEDVRGVQLALDLVDARFSAISGTTRTAAIFSRVAVGIAAIGSLIAGQIALLIVTAIALLVPVTSLVAAAGAASLVSGLLAWRDADLSFAGDATDGTALLLALAGVVLLLLAFMRRAEAAPRWAARVALWVAVAVPLVVVPFIGAPNGFALHQTSRAWPVAVMLPIVAAVLNLFSRTTMGRAAAACSVAVAAGTAFLGSTAALDLLSHDPLRVSASAPALAEITGDEIGRVTSSVPLATIRVSPDAQAVLLIADQDEQPNVAFAGRIGAALTRLEATDGVFLDPRRVVLMTRRDTSARVSIVDVDTMTTSWTLEVLDLSWARLARDRVGEHWSLVGYGAVPGTHRIRYVRGNLAGEVVVRREWDPMADGEPIAGQPIAVSGDRVVMWSSDYRPGWLDRVPLGSRIRGDLQGRVRSRLISVGANDARELVATDLGLSCVAAIDDDAAPICTASDGHETRVVRIDPVTGAVTGVLAVSGELYVQEYSSPQAVTGFGRRGSFGLDLETRTMVFPPGRSEDELHVALSSTVAAVASSDGAGEIVRVYAIRRGPAR